MTTDIPTSVYEDAATALVRGEDITDGHIVASWIRIPERTDMITKAEAQSTHDRLRAEHPDHDQVSCWCCCMDCNFDWDKVTGWK